MLFKKENNTPGANADVFWQEYEEKTGEKVLSRGLGKYISGWDEFDQNRQGGIWGLIIRTSGGFRFHHFPQKSWIDSFTSFVKTEEAKEKTIFIPNEKIVLSKVIKEPKWWKRLFNSSPPLFVIRYSDDAKTGKEERSLVFEAEFGDDFLNNNNR